MERFNGKTILVTGAGDIAQATARRLLSEGGCVALTDFSKDALAETAQALSYVTELTDRDPLEG